DDDSRCVLCQQTLREEGRERLSRFDGFVRDDTQTRLEKARRLQDDQTERLRGLLVSPDAVVNNLKDLETTYREIIAEVRDILEKYETAREQTLEALANSREIPQPGIEPGNIISRLAEASKQAKASAEDLANP